MELAIPVFNETFHKPGEKTPMYRCCALFDRRVSAEDASLRRATSRLIRRLREKLNGAGRSWNHNNLARMIFNPQMEGARHKLLLELNDRRAKANFYFVKFQILERTIVYIPKMPQLWFELREREDLKERATDVLQKYFRRLWHASEATREPEDYAIGGESWVSWTDLDVRVDPASEDELKKQMLALFSNQQMDGATELNKTGRNLDHLYPDDLDRALLRDEQVAELDRLLNHFGRRPVLLVGPRSVGKTNLIHELVFRRVQRRTKKHSSKKNVWWLSPQRLITGMSFVGQWENRLLAILEEAKKQSHILYFDDVIGMFRAGQSRDSNLCVADLIKNSLQSKQVRMLAEMTNEQFQVLAARDRGFADQFHVLQVKPTGRDETQRIAIQSMQKLEMENRCVFDLSVLPTASKLQQNYSQAEVFPGKLVKFLNSLAVKNRGNNRINASHTIQQFQTLTGLAYELLDDDCILNYEEIRNNLANRIVGQRKAVESCARIVSVSKARLNEPDRPLGTLLFVGPTGVGKTECAKALCEVMFRNPDRLIRIDLNQFKSAFSAGTLIGSESNPEGILTSAVRQQPFSILLLDEIEKAHPDVFDILLQVLGEGRLTDALGRTTDFSNCIVIMTSNLGTRRSEQGIGFVPGDAEHRFVRAAREFFRPEFFNRIDEIVPFEKLKRKEIAKIAQRLIKNIVSRQGLVRRQCMLQIEQSAIEQIVEEGYHPTLGARAMKRALEERFTQPVARQLAKMPFDNPTLIRVFEDQRQLQVGIKELEQAERARPANFRLTTEEVIACGKAFLDRVDTSVLSNRPEGEISSDGLTPQLLRYFAIDEQANRVQESLQKLIDFKSRSMAPQIDGQATIPVPRKSSRSYDMVHSGKNLMKEVFAAHDIDDYVKDNHLPPNMDPVDNLCQEIIDESAMLDCMIRSPELERALLFVRSVQPEDEEAEINGYNQIRISLAGYLEQSGFDVTAIKFDSRSINSLAAVFDVAGPCVGAILDEVIGSYLHVTSTGQNFLYQVGYLPEKEIASSGQQETIDKYLGSMSFATDPSNPVAIRPVNRINRQGKIIDLRSGMTFNRGAIVAEDWQMFFIRGLSLPQEFTNNSNPISDDDS